MERKKTAVHVQLKMIRRKKVISVNDSFMCIILKSQFLGQIYNKWSGSMRQQPGKLLLPSFKK